MKQTLVKKYVYEGYAFTITVILNSKLVDAADYYLTDEAASTLDGIKTPADGEIGVIKDTSFIYIHQISVMGKDYLETSEITSDMLEKSIATTEAKIKAFVDRKLNVSDDENFLKEKGFLRVSY